MRWKRGKVTVGNADRSFQNGHSTRASPAQPGQLCRRLVQRNLGRHGSRPQASTDNARLSPRRERSPRMEVTGLLAWHHTHVDPRTHHWVGAGSDSRLLASLQEGKPLQATSVNPHAIHSGHSSHLGQPRSPGGTDTPMLTSRGPCLKDQSGMPVGRAVPQPTTRLAALCTCHLISFLSHHRISNNQEVDSSLHLLKLA